MNRMCLRYAFLMTLLVCAGGASRAAEIPTPVCEYWQVPAACTSDDLAEKGPKMGAKGYVPDGTALGKDVVGGKGPKPRPHGRMKPVERPQLPPTQSDDEPPNITILDTTPVPGELLPMWRRY